MHRLSTVLCSRSVFTSFAIPIRPSWSRRLAWTGSAAPAPAPALRSTKLGFRLIKFYSSCWPAGWGGAVLGDGPFRPQIPHRMVLSADQDGAAATTTNVCFQVLATGRIRDGTQSLTHFTIVWVCAGVRECVYFVPFILKFMMSSLLLLCTRTFAQAAKFPICRSCCLFCIVSNRARWWCWWQQLSRFCLLFFCKSCVKCNRSELWQ